MPPPKVSRHNRLSVAQYRGSAVVAGFNVKYLPGLPGSWTPELNHASMAKNVVSFCYKAVLGGHAANSRLDAAEDGCPLAV